METKADIYGKSITFYTVIGEVVKSDKYTETHISANHSHSRFNSSSNVNIGSNIITNHEIFVKEDGTNKDIPIKLFRDDILVREGNKITLLYAMIGHSDYLLKLYNQATGNSYIITPIKNIAKYFISSFLDILTLISYVYAFLGGGILLLLFLINFIAAGAADMPIRLSEPFYIGLFIEVCSIILIIRSIIEENKVNNILKAQINNISNKFNMP